MEKLYKHSLEIESKNIQNGKKLNWLRAAVLGANDGIVSVSSVVVGVAGVENSTRFILTAGTAALVAGALSMAVGEYVSVSSQRDAEIELKVEESKLISPWHATYASALSFFAGGVVPIIIVSVFAVSSRITATFISVVCVLVIIGFLSARAGGANKTKAIIRVVMGGLLAMLLTFSIGKLLGVSGI
jgi:VIT1/CCC1 family predicted Fe2+/Mn2+ transporter